MIAVVAAPSPSPTAGPTPLEKAGSSPTFWLVVVALIAFFLVVRAVNRALGWGSRGDA